MNTVEKIIKKKYSKSPCRLSRPMYLTPKDKRYEKQKKQLKERGFSDSEIWSLYNSIAEYMIPRLVRFRKTTIGYPGNFESIKKWHEMLDDMIFAFVWALECDDWPEELDKTAEKKHWARYRRGMKYFAEYFLDLWW